MTKIALIAALVIGTGSVALAAEGFRPRTSLNRYPAYHMRRRMRAGPAFTSRSVSMNGGAQAVVIRSES